MPANKSDFFSLGFSSWLDGDDWFQRVERQTGIERERKVPTLIPERPCCLSSTFSGFISQWIILFLYRVSRHWSREWANLRTSCRENPWNLFFLISSYRLIDKSSNVMHVCDLKQKGVSFQKSGSTSHAQECSTAYLETSYFKMAKKIAPILHIKTLQC